MVAGLQLEIPCYASCYPPCHQFFKKTMFLYQQGGELTSTVPPCVLGGSTACHLLGPGPVGLLSIERQETAHAEDQDPRPAVEAIEPIEVGPTDPGPVTAHARPHRQGWKALRSRSDLVGKHPSNCPTSICQLTSLNMFPPKKRHLSTGDAIRLSFWSGLSWSQGEVPAGESPACEGKPQPPTT